MPGDPAYLWAGPRATIEQIQNAHETLGLDKPILIQYFIYLKKISKGDLGISIQTKQAVKKELANRVPATLELILFSIFIIILSSLPLGYWGALKKEKLADSVNRIFYIAGVSFPIFWLGIILQTIFHGKLSIFPLQGRISESILISDNFAPLTGFYILDSLLKLNIHALFNILSHIILPSACIVISSIALISRMFRSSMIEAMENNFVLSLRSFGISKSTIAKKFAFKIAFFPTLNLIGLAFGYLIGGTVVVETIFDWPGLGKFAVDSVFVKDIPSVLGVTLVFSTFYVFINLVVDLIQLFVDPRLRRASVN